MNILRLPVGLALLLCAACSSDEDSPGGSTTTTVTAEAALSPKSGNTTLGGVATFTQTDDGDTSLTLEVTGAPPGQHGAHIHQTGDCSAPDAMSAGGHWNPETHDHGQPAPTSHLGDLGNLTVDADGRGTLTLTKGEWDIEEDGDDGGNVVGKAVVIHADVDDFTTQPTGNSGGRIGCGVIQFTSTETIETN